MILKKEKDVFDYLTKNWKKIFPKYKLLAHPVNILGSYTKRRIGEADILFKKAKTHYIAEIKWGQDLSTDLWTSLKAIGYAKAYQLETGFHTQPVVVLRETIMTNDIKYLFYELKLYYITLYRSLEGIVVDYYFGKWEGDQNDRA